MLVVQQFIENLDHVPWFRRLGKPSIRDKDVFRIHSWQTWPGPENPGAVIQSEYHMLWRRNLFQADELPPNNPLTDLWEQIHSKVFNLARANVPFYEEEDDWYGPNAAVWSVSWVAALVGCTLVKEGGFLKPERLNSQWTIDNEWEWYCDGHWPCSYFWSWGYSKLDAVERTGGPRKLIVY